MPVGAALHSVPQLIRLAVYFNIRKRLRAVCGKKKDSFQQLNGLQIRAKDVKITRSTQWISLFERS